MYRPLPYISHTNDRALSLTWFINKIIGVHSFVVKSGYGLAWSIMENKL
eukprot:SAG31_NODE_45318_length_259_cov_0.875000_1_plen_48_part_01